VNVLVVTGIWPPDPGGPASHAPALGKFLEGRGHTVEVVTTAQVAPPAEPFEIRWVSRSLPPGIRHLRVASVVRTSGRRADVIYATSMVRRAALGAALARRPLVVKLVSDEVFERVRRSGRFEGTLDDFQRVAGGIRTRFLLRTRDLALRRARHVFCPSAYLRDVALGWGIDPGRVSVLANPAPDLPRLPSRDELRAELHLEGRVLAFAGRLGPQKALGVALEAIAAVPDVTLAIAGDGPERGALEARTHELGLDGRARFLGSVSREAVLRLFRAADASVLSSSWENFPHTVVEALAVGTPVIATAVGGVPEVVRDGGNGLLVKPGEPTELAGAIRRFFEDEALRRRLGAAAVGSVAAYTETAVFTRIEEELVRAAAR
jgi:glycosyltransferase involved in cell wall biosynthesis